MTKTLEFEKQTKDLIDGLKSICANYGLGNDGNEFKVITQIFLYKFLNDKFIYESKKADERFTDTQTFETKLSEMSEDETYILNSTLPASTAMLESKHLISNLFNKQNQANFSEIFDSTLLDIAKLNNNVFSVSTNTGEKVVLFDRISQYVTDNRDEFCKALINKLVDFNFENIFEEGFDFYATIFEYLIKDYNTNSGGKYAEYFTPHAVSKIMAKSLVSDNTKNVSCYDPSAGSGTLLMNLAYQIGAENCTIYTQDISQKSSHLLRLNLILNGLVHSIQNVVKGNTIKDPFHRDKEGRIRKFDFIVSNPPFKLDFSEYRDELDTKSNKERYFAGIPNVPAKKKESMAIYLLFLQHIIYSLNEKGKAAVVVPTGFITAQSGIDKKIRQKLVDEKMLAGVVSMPSNIFANTGTNVSILFIDKEANEQVVLIDASNLGETIKEGKNQKTVLTYDEEDSIIDTFKKKEAIEDFSVVVSYDDIKEKNYSLSAGQYFEVKIEYVDITHEEFETKMRDIKSSLGDMFSESHSLEKEIQKNLELINYD